MTKRLAHSSLDRRPEAARFLRDAEAVAALASALELKGPVKGGPRIWVTSGSMGEDAYSVCIALLEAFGPRGARGLRVFGTSADPAVVAKARAGLYDPVAALPRVVGARVSGHFIRHIGAWSVGKALRARCVFARHDLCADQPLIRLDAVYCGLPLSRWPAASVEQALRRFEFSLKPGGLLLLADPSFEPRSAVFSRLTSKLYERTARVPAKAADEAYYRCLTSAADTLLEEWTGVSRKAVSGESNKRQDELAAMVSHELRTPLAAIIGFTETLQTGSVGAREVKDFLETIENNARRLLRTVDGLIGSVGAPARREKRPVPLLEAATAAAEMMAPQAREARVTVSVTMEKSLTALCDPADLPHVLENLIGNAIKYNHPGGRVEVTACAPQAGLVAMTVHDTGPGISVDNLARIFDRFFRCEATKHLPGSGLGLSIVRNLIEANGGTVAARSLPGEGAQFVVTLPAA